MSTVQSNLLKLALVVDKQTKDGQKFQGSSSAVTITGVANNGSGLIRITAANHNFQTGNKVYVISVGGTTEANNTAGNPNWTVTRISSSTFDLQGSTFSNAWTSGGTATGALIGSVDGSVFTRQRLLDIYNDSRFALFQVMRSSMGNDEISKNVSAMFISAAITFSAASPNTTAPKPTGFLKLESLMATGSVPVIVLPNELLITVRSGTNPYYTISATNLLAFEIGTNFLIPALFGAGAGIIDYYGITSWTLTDVLAGTAVEVFSGEYEPMLIQLAQAIANEQSTQDVNLLAKKLLGKE